MEHYELLFIYITIPSNVIFEEFFFVQSKEKKNLYFQELLPNRYEYYWIRSHEELLVIVNKTKVIVDSEDH